MPNYQFSHLDQLEAEAIFVLRETAAQFENPALLFSGGKDSIVMAWLARKAFWPARMPFPLVHVDTGHNFPETMAFRDEEKARAKERFFSHRDEFGQWDPKNQRPELWNLFNGKYHPGEHFRVFPLSNFTEMDIWMYLKREQIPLPSIYFAHDREVFERNGSLLAVTDFLKPQDHETATTRRVRFRTIGDATCTGAVASTAATLDEVIAEVAAARQTERGTRSDDKRSETAMEDRKKEGYF